jgi:hypothetical protein
VSADRDEGREDGGWKLGWECITVLCVTAEQVHGVTEMEFLDISLTKDSSLLFHAIHWRISKKTIVLQKTKTKNPYKKIRETRKLLSIHE